MVNGPFGAALDPAAGRIYWANYAGNRISFARLDGSVGGDLATGGATLSAPTFPRSWSVRAAPACPSWAAARRSARSFPARLVAGRRTW